MTPGPLKASDGTPYDYIVVIDAGSTGSRVFIYNWLSPYNALKNNHDLSVKTKKKGKKGKTNKNTHKNKQSNKDSNEDDSDSDSDSEESVTTPKGSADTDSPASVVYPQINFNKKWSQRITPGVSSFASSPQKVGNHHIRNLLQVASSVVPRLQHYRTPIFLHATAGMRFLAPDEQLPILEAICLYLKYNSDFYVPDCLSHVNVIDGDIEGIYGWLSVNSLIGSFDNPEDHQHGKNHTTYGLLDMGGASTQVVFQPNMSEIAHHDNNLYKVHLNHVPTIENNKYSPPEDEEFNIYSDSFLGFGMFQAHSRYQHFLNSESLKDADMSSGYWSARTPISDPCLPKGYTTTAKVEDEKVDFIGESDFEKCLQAIFPVLVDSTHSGGDQNCKQFNEHTKVSSCLMNELIPSFDFDVNHFVGVSGYWDALKHLLSYKDKLPRDNFILSDLKSKRDSDSDTYDYKVIYKETSKLCSQSFSELIQLNSLKPEQDQMKEDDLAELCFKASWILNFLHVGLGFPRLGIDKMPPNDQFKSLQLAEKIGGSTFSWTLGRAMLYANDEYVQAYNNFTEETQPKAEKIARPGYYYTALSSVFHYGAEPAGVSPRPMFTEPDPSAGYQYYDYSSTVGDELKWYIEPHRWYGSFTLMLLMGFIIYLMVGRGGRAVLVQSIKTKLKTVSSKVKNLVTHFKGDSYVRIPTDLEGSVGVNDVELNNMLEQARKSTDEE